MKYIVNFSGGWCSFWSAMRTVEIYGKENTILLFADVLIEDDDLYEFNKTASGIIGVPITRISLEMSPWQLFRERGIIGNDRRPLCSIILKREPLNSWMAKNFELDRNQTNALSEDATVVLGFDFTEFNRFEDFQNAHPTWRVSAPMTEGQLWDKCRMQSEGELLGIKTPKLYRMGFPHNNCGGGCVKAGISHFVNLYYRLPAVFWRWAAEESYTQHSNREKGSEHWNFTILKDRRGGKTNPLPLIELAYRIESGEQFPTDDHGGCGCGGVT